MKEKKWKQQGVLSVVLAMVLLIFIIGIILFSNKLMMDRIWEDFDLRIEESVATNLAFFELQINEQIEKVKTLAQFLGTNDDLRSEENVKLLQSAVENNGLLRCAIAFPDGSFITHDGTTGDNVSNDAFFKANMAGEFYITDPRPAVVDTTKTVILFSSPIISQGEVKGSLIYSYLSSDIDRIFNLGFLEEKGTILVINREGRLLIGETPYGDIQDNLLEYLRSQCTHEEHSPEKCVVLSEDSGSFDLSLKGNKSPLHLHYDDLAYKDWMILSIIPEEDGMEAFSYVVQVQRNLEIIVLICLFIYVIIVLITWKMRNTNVDKMTGVLTLNGFKGKVRKILRKTKDRNHVVIQLDIKNFKLINRIHDFSTGDEVIKAMAAALNEAIGEEGTACARVSVDCFLVFLPYHGSKWLNERRQSFIDSFKRKMHQKNKKFSTTINFPTGQYLLTEEDYLQIDVSELIEKVNFAHRDAKHNFDTIIDYKGNIEKKALVEKDIEDRMKGALINKEFTLYLQPKYRLSDETICGAEALVRWKINGVYYLYPMEFIPTLERNGFIVELDMYMFEAAAKKLREMIDEDKMVIPISVNFSRHHLHNENFVNELTEIADRYFVPHRFLEVEITESALFDNIEKMRRLIDQVHEAGFSISIDDFGSGYSSFNQLVDLNVDILKLDKGFFSDMSHQGRREIIISSVLDMARKLKITTVAEGIEEEAQIRMLQKMGCDIVQGYYYSKPKPAQEIIEEFLTKNK